MIRNPILPKYHSLVNGVLRYTCVCAAGIYGERVAGATGGLINPEPADRRIGSTPTLSVLGFRGRLDLRSRQIENPTPKKGGDQMWFVIVLVWTGDGITILILI